MTEKKLKQKISGLRELIKKQEKELQCKYPNVENPRRTTCLEFLGDPLFQKNEADRERLKELLIKPERFSDLFLKVLPSDALKLLKKRHGKEWFSTGIKSGDFSIEGIKQEKIKIELSFENFETLVDAIVIASKYPKNFQTISKVHNNLVQKVTDAESCFMDKGLPGYDHNKALRKSAKTLGFSSPGKGKQKRFSGFTEWRIKNDYETLIEQGTDKKSAIKQIKEKFDFNSLRSCADNLRSLGLKKIPSFLDE
jgi:hypothetical protein